jgi:hypothetical protein
MDLSAYTDAELEAIAGGPAPAAPAASSELGADSYELPAPSSVAPSTPPTDFSAYSDAELESVANGVPADSAPSSIAPSSPPDLSTYTDAELYRAAGVDPLSSFDAYKAFEAETAAKGYDPQDPGILSKIGSGIGGMLKDVAALGTEFLYNQGEKWMSGGPDDPKQDRLTAAVDRENAMAVSAAGQIAGNYGQMALGTKRLAEKASTGIQSAFASDPVAKAKVEEAGQRAAYQYALDSRDLSEAANGFRQDLGVLFPDALGKIAQTTIDEEATRGLSMVADPLNYIPVAQGAGWAVRLPMRGAVRAAEASAMEAALAFAKASASHEAADVLVQAAREAGTAAAIKPALVESLKTAGETLAARKQAYFDLVAQQKGELGGLVRTAEAVTPAQQGVALAAQGAGKALDAAGRAVQAVADLPEAIGRHFAPGNDVAQEVVGSAVRTGTSLVGGVVGDIGRMSAAAGRTISKAGQDLRIVGEILGQAEGQLPFFRTVARQTSGVTSFVASAIDESRLAPMLTTGGTVLAEGSRGAPLAALQGYVASGGDTEQLWVGGATGTFLGMAGASAGQWRRYAQPEVIRARQGADVVRYRNSMAAQGPEVSAFFDRLPNRDQVALSTFQLAHPDLAIRYANLGPGRSSFYTTGGENGPVAMINLQSRDPIRAVAAHEVAHHIEKHGLFPSISRELLGDAEINRPGVYTARDAQGNPLKDAQGRYQTNADWQALKDAYQTRLDAEAGRTGLSLGNITDANLAREVFAEHAADYLLGANTATGELNIAAAMRAPSTRVIRALAESRLGDNLPFIQRLAAKTGSIIDHRGDVVGSRLFSPDQLKQSTELRRMVDNYTRENAQRARPEKIDDEGGKGSISYNAAEIRANPHILQTLFDGSSDIARGPDGKPIINADGSPRFQTAKEIARQQQSLTDKIWQYYEANPTDRGGLRMEQIPNEKTGKLEDHLTGPLPANLLQELAKDNNYNPTQLAHLAMISEHLAATPGKVLSMFYQPATKGGSDVRYRSLKGDWRTEAPYALAVSKAGNIFTRNMSKEKLVANAEAMINRGNGKLWGDNIGSLLGDLDTYLANHAAGKPGDAGIGAAKRDHLNELFGISKKGMEDVNPLFTSKRSSPVIRSRRVDRMNRVVPVEGELFPTNYEMLRANRRPEAVSP